jgi:chaperone modulatory protein CbpM
MKVEFAEVLLIDEHGALSLTQLAELSRLPQEDLLELVACEALVPLDPYASEPSFGAHALLTARTAARLRADFELDAHGVVLALALLDRIDELEARVRELMAQLPHRLR